MSPLREAVPGDASQIAAVETAATPHPWTRSQIEGTLTTASTRAWVVEQGTVCAHVLVSVAGPSADILTIAVHPDHQRQGIARTLLSHAHAALRDAGVLDVFLEVRDTNTPAIGLYASHGYVQVGMRRQYYRDGSDARVMQREL